MSEHCSHLDQVAMTELPAAVDGCEECLRDGGKWLHLRICLRCGHVGCCDDSPNRHATAPITTRPRTRSSTPSSPARSGAGYLGATVLGYVR